MEEILVISKIQIRVERSQKSGDWTANFFDYLIIRNERFGRIRIGSVATREQGRSKSRWSRWLDWWSILLQKLQSTYVNVAILYFFLDTTNTSHSDNYFFFFYQFSVFLTVVVRRRCWWKLLQILAIIRKFSVY